MKEAKYKKGEKGGFSFIGGYQIFIMLGHKDTMRIEGVKKILLCHTDQVHLRVKNGTLRILGKELVCITYISGAVEITGRIEKWLAEGREGCAASDT